MTFEIKQMWSNGPWRQFAADGRPASNWLPYDTGGFVGRYVCAACRKLTNGVYRCRNEWNCAACCTNAPRKEATGD